MTLVSISNFQFKCEVLEMQVGICINVFNESGLLAARGLGVIGIRHRCSMAKQGIAGKFLILLAKIFVTDGRLQVGDEFTHIIESAAQR